MAGYFIGTVPAGKVCLGSTLRTYTSNTPLSVEYISQNGTKLELTREYAVGNDGIDDGYDNFFYAFDQPATVEIHLSGSQLVNTFRDGDYYTLTAVGVTGIKGMSYMCSGCENLKQIDLTDFSVSTGISSIQQSFEFCSSLQEIIWPDENIWASTVNCRQAFAGCGLTHWDIPNLHPGNVSDMFANSKLQTIKINQWTDTQGYGIFSQCASLNEIYLNCDSIPAAYVNAFTDIKPNGTLYVPIGLENLEWEENNYWYRLFDNYQWNIKTIEVLIWDFPTEPINLECQGGTFNIDFTTNKEISNIIIRNVPDWLSFNREGNSIIGVATPNGTAQSRSATLEFIAEGFGVTKTLTITQEVLDWEIEFTSYEFWSESSYPHNSNSDLGLIFSVSEKLTDLEITTNASWLRSENYSPTIQLWAQPNRLGDYRSTTVTLYSPSYNSSRTLNIGQRGLNLTLNGSAVTTCEGGTVTIPGSMPEGWVYLDELTVKSPVDVTIVTTDGNAITPRKCEVTLDIPLNTGKARVFDCLFYVNGKNVGGATITQESCDITVDTPEVAFDYPGGSVDVYIESASPWRTEIVGDWITVTPASGEGDNLITISVSENEFADVRTGYVYITNDADREPIVIHQAGANPYLYFNKHYVPVRLDGDTKRIKLYNNLRWATKWETQ